MIKNFTQFNEGINHLLVGPSIDEMLDKLKNGHLSPNRMLEKSIKWKFKEGIEYALEKGATLYLIPEYFNKISLYIDVTEIKEKVFDYLKTNWLSSDINEFLCKCCEFGIIKGVEHALEKGADIHYEGGKPTYNSIYYGHLDIFKYLVKNGADVHYGNDYAIRTKLIDKL